MTVVMFHPMALIWFLTWFYPIMSFWGKYGKMVWYTIYQLPVVKGVVSTPSINQSTNGKRTSMVLSVYYINCHTYKQPVTHVLFDDSPMKLWKTILHSSRTFSVGIPYHLCSCGYGIPCGLGLNGIVGTGTVAGWPTPAVKPKFTTWCHHGSRGSHGKPHCESYQILLSNWRSTSPSRVKSPTRQCSKF